MNTAINLKRSMMFSIFLVVSSLASATDVGVSVSIGQPGFYGRIDIGDYPYPYPRVIYDRPVIVRGHFDEYEPVYLRVPPGHARNWSRFCGRYNACDRRVYFVDDRWYRNEYVPAYRDRHGDARYDRNDRHEDQGRHEGGRGNNGRGRGGERD